MTCAGFDIGILRGVLMALWAMGFRGFHNGSMSTRYDGILHVLALGSPVQVIQPVVGRVVVAVAAMQTFRARADEGRQGEHMNRDLLAFPVPV